MVWMNEETLSKQHKNVGNTRTAYALILGCMLKIVQLNINSV